MNPQAQKVKAFCRTAVALCIVGLLLYTLCYFYAGDGSDYFVSGHPLPLIANILSIVSLIWFLCTYALIPKDSLPTDDFMIATDKPLAIAAAPLVGTLAAGAISFTYYEPADLISIFLLREKTMSATTVCALLCALGAALCAAYFFFRMINTPSLNTACVILGAGPIALLTGLCGLTYFELDHHMNAPAKIGLQLAWIATMLFIVCELRCTLGKAQPRRYLSTACIAVFANACACAPLFKYLIAADNASHKTRILGFVLFCACNCVYIAYRLFQFCALCTQSAQPDSTEISPVPDQTQGKDDHDGCQQQDSMAS
jgi:hypothetical protein